MKKTITMSFVVLLVVGLLGIVSAENLTEEEIRLPEPGRGTAIGNAWDQLRLVFTFDKAEKAEKALDIAEKRLAEAEANAKENPEKAEKARERYEYFAEKAEESMEDIREAENINEANESFGKLMRVQERFELHQERAIKARSMALQKMAEGNMSEEQIEKISKIFEGIENRSLEMREKMQQKRSNLETVFKTRAEINEKELGEIMQNVEKEQGLEEARERRAKRLESLAKEREQIRERIRERTNISEQAEEKVQEKIENLSKEIEEKMHEGVNKSQEKAGNLSNFTEQAEEKVNQTTNLLKNR